MNVFYKKKKNLEIVQQKDANVMVNNLVVKSFFFRFLYKKIFFLDRNALVM